MEARGPALIVVDTNVIAHLMGDDAPADAAHAVMSVDAHWVAPAIWRSELRNVLVRSCRARRLHWEECPRIMEFAERRMEGGSHEMPSASVLAFARRTGCTAYDSEFGALAEELAVPLVTTDRALLAALPGRAFTPEAFIDTR